MPAEMMPSAPRQGERQAQAAHVYLVEAVGAERAEVPRATARKLLARERGTPLRLSRVSRTLGGTECPLG